MTDYITVGFDPGNSEAMLLAALGGKTATLTIPSFIGAGSLEALRRVRGGTGSSQSLEAGEYMLDVAGVSHFVGALALEQSLDASSARGDTQRYYTGHTLRLLMVLAGALIKAPSFRLRVVTGLPVKVWNRETTVPRVQQSLGGVHHFSLNGRAREMTVESVMVVMEGAGALAAHGLAEEVPQAVVDVGSRTTDLFWAQGMRPVLPRCTGFDIGVGKVSDLLAGWFEARYGRALTDGEVRSILWASAHSKLHPPLFADGARVALDGEVERFVASVGEEIVREVGRAWRSSEQGKVAANAARARDRRRGALLRASTQAHHPAARRAAPSRAGKCPGLPRHRPAAPRAGLGTPATVGGGCGTTPGHNALPPGRAPLRRRRCDAGRVGQRGGSARRRVAAAPLRPAARALSGEARSVARRASVDARHSSGASSRPSRQCCRPDATNGERCRSGVGRRAPR